tara:strand:- start:269 stop:598 length:330 start_codon:yes stop_codon:yes gene_type:complete
MLIVILFTLIIFAIRFLVFFKKNTNLFISFRNYLKNINEINFQELINGETKKIDKFIVEGISLLYEIFLFSIPFILINRFIYYAISWNNILSFFLSLTPYFCLIKVKGK